MAKIVLSIFIRPSQWCAVAMGLLLRSPLRISKRQHQHAKNGGQDAWNNENFSVINNYAQGYNIHAELVERAYPRAVQGRTLHFAYEGLVPDRANSVMSYHSIRAGLAGQFAEKNSSATTNLLSLAWQGRNSHAPTELYIPRHISAENLVVVTDAGVFKNLSVNAPFTQAQNEVALISDPNKAQGAGHVLLVWDDVDANENLKAFILPWPSTAALGFGDAELTQLQSGHHRTPRQQAKPCI